MTDLRPVLTEDATAECVGLRPSTMAKLRLSGKGPVFCKLGRRIVYRPEDVERWLAEHCRQSTSEYGPPQQPSGKASASGAGSGARGTQKASSRGRRRSSRQSDKDDPASEAER